MAKEPLPDSIKEMIERDGASLEDIAHHMGLGVTEVANQYDLSAVTFREVSGAEAQAEAKAEQQPGTQPS